MFVDDSLQTVFQERCAEVDKQPEGQIHQAQVGQELFGMNRVEVFDRLQFNDQLSIDQQIQPKTCIELNALVTDGNRFLPLDQ